MTHLVPKLVTDRNGKVTTVYVNPNQHQRSEAGIPTITSVRQQHVTNSAAVTTAQIEQFAFRDSSERKVYDDLVELPDGWAESVRFRNPNPSGSYTYISYDKRMPEKLLVQTSLRRRNDELIMMRASEEPVTITTTNGTEHVAPFLPVCNGKEVAISEKEFQELNYMHRAFDTACKTENVEEWSPDGDHADSIAKLIILEGRKFGGVRP